MIRMGLIYRRSALEGTAGTGGAHVLTRRSACFLPPVCTQQITSVGKEMHTGSLSSVLHEAHLQEPSEPAKPWSRTGRDLALHSG